MDRQWLTLGVMGMWALSMPAILRAQTPMVEDPLGTPPLRAPEHTPPEREVCVPLWTEPLGSDRELPAAVRGVRVEFRWERVPFPAVDRVPPQAPSANERQVRTSASEASMHEHARRGGCSTRGVEPVMEPPAASAILLAFRPAAASRPVDRRRDLELVIRLSAVQAGAVPFVDVVDAATLLSARDSGRLVRRTADGTEWLFVVRDPAPPPLPGARNAISARLAVRPGAPRTFAIHLVSEASPAAPGARLPRPAPGLNSRRAGR
jgi:hypothetical protein